MALTGLSTRDPGALRALRRVLLRHGYAHAGIDPTVLTGTMYPRLPREREPATPPATLLRLFHLNRALPRRQVEAALSPLRLETACQLGVVHLEGTKVYPQVQIQTYRRLLFAVDVPARYARSEDVVMSVAPSSIEVAQMTVRRRARQSLDLGTGCGIEALLAAAHSGRVYAVDVNPRALEFARFNCLLNGIENVVAVKGNLCDPVRRQRFDLIVSNPPFVISPFTHVTFRDAGMKGDERCVLMARSAARLLNEGGYFQMIYQWIQPPGEDWREFLSRRFGNMGCDAHGYRILVQDPETYVAEWTPLLYGGHPRKVERLQRDWLGYFQQHCAESIGTLLLTLCKREAARHFTRFEDAPEDRSKPYGERIARKLRAITGRRLRTRGAVSDRG